MVSNSHVCTPQHVANVIGQLNAHNRLGSTLSSLLATNSRLVKWQLLTWTNVIFFYNIRFSHTPNSYIVMDKKVSSLNSMVQKTWIKNAILEAVRYIMALTIMQTMFHIPLGYDY